MEVSNKLRINLKKNQSWIIIGLLSVLVFFSEQTLSSPVAGQVFSKNELPFGVSYETWLAEYYKWWVDTNVEEATPQPGGCLINGSGKMVMLMETADVTYPPEQNCKISSTQGIFFPLWAAWCDTGGDIGNIKDPKGNLDEQLATCAKEVYNLGDIKSEVNLDGKTVAKLDIRNSILSGKFDSKITTMTNVSEISTNGFNITIPPDTHKPNYPEGTWRAGAQGWLVFLKPLLPGEHELHYNIRITPTSALTSPGTNPHFADITYKFDVQ